MTSTPNEPEDTSPAGRNDSQADVPGIITDDQLPEDLQPTDDNPLAKNPDEEGAAEGGDAGAGAANPMPGDGQTQQG
ncbi:MAG: hypothetical protein M3393_01680 [Actinomycetota bacterium]|nr:hypothetical protein [Actinomycetota bacterium]